MPAPEEPTTAWGEPTSGRSGGASGPRAGFWRRFGAAFIDALILGVLYAVLVAVLNAGAAYVIYLIANYTYFTVLEGGPTGQTVGKKALGIRVIDFRAGGPIGYGRGLLRNLAKILSSIPILLGYLWMLWDPEKQTWHDKIATTVVVPADAYPTS
jgi:uncharacterized RDD family membrane protein YckC